MRAEMGCDRASPEISALLDGELDRSTAAEVAQHVAACPRCSDEKAAVERIRRSLRAQPAEVVPDLTSRIMSAIEAERDRRSPWPGRIRTAVVAAVISGLVLMGGSLPFTRDEPATATAAEIAVELRKIAAGLERYRATFEIVEAGWHPRMPVRRFRARLWFEAPERLRLQVDDLNDYPSAAWPRNEVTLVATGRRWSISEPTSCPAAALPGCALAGQRETRTIVNRQPFDGSTPLPTDIVVPLESVAGSSGLRVQGRRQIAGRSAHLVSLPFHQAAPLIDALQAGGVWRDFHPFDEVRIWIDAATWFPLRFEVRAGDSAGRGRWSQQRGYRDRDGTILLGVRAVRFDRPRTLDPALFEVEASGVTSNGGFVPRPLFGTPVAPRDLAGLRPYRSGITRFGEKIVTYSKGMTWLKVVSSAAPSAAHPDGEAVILGDGGTAYYEPAVDGFRRRVDLFESGRHIHLESNLPRARLLTIAGSLPGTAVRLPDRTRSAGGVVERLDPDDAYRRTAFARRPGYLPAGYKASTAFLTRSQDGRVTLTVHYRRSEVDLDPEGIAITWSRPVRVFLPSSEDFEFVEIEGATARWSAARGELETIAGGIYRSVTTRSFDLSTARRIVAEIL